MPELHKLKTWSEYFNAVKEGRKTFEIRKDDRNFQVGDRLLLQEYNPRTGMYEMGELEVKVMYILQSERFGLKRDYVIMGISL